jgi:hypothetical protein
MQRDLHRGPGKAAIVIIDCDSSLEIERVIDDRRERPDRDLGNVVGITVPGRAGVPAHHLGDALDTGIIEAEAREGGIGTVSEVVLPELPSNIRTVTIDINLQMTRFEGSYNDGYADNLSFSITGAAVPEPSTIGLLATGVLVIIGYGRRARKAELRHGN